MVDEFIARELIVSVFNPSFRSDAPDRAQQTDVREKTRNAYSVTGLAYAVKYRDRGVVS